MPEKACSNKFPPVLRNTKKPMEVPSKDYGSGNSAHQDFTDGAKVGCFPQLYEAKSAAQLDQVMRL